MADVGKLKRLVKRYRDRLLASFDRATVSSLALRREDNIRTLVLDARDLMNRMVESLGASPRSRVFGRYVTPHLRRAIQSLGRIERKAQTAGLTATDINIIARGLLRVSTDGRVMLLLERAGITKADIKGLAGLRHALARILVDQGFRVIRSLAVLDFRKEGWATAVWTLSPVHSVKDDCDGLAGRRFRLDQWPDPPHVNCGCMPTDPA